MSRETYAQTLIELQGIVDRQDANAPAPTNLVRLCGAMQQDLDEQNDLFQEDDFRLVSAAAMANVNVAEIVAEYRLDSVQA